MALGCGTSASCLNMQEAHCRMSMSKRVNLTEDKQNLRLYFKILLIKCWSRDIKAIKMFKILGTRWTSYYFRQWGIYLEVNIFLRDKQVFSLAGLLFCYLVCWVLNKKCFLLHLNCLTQCSILWIGHIFSGGMACICWCAGAFKCQVGYSLLS